MTSPSRPPKPECALLFAVVVAAGSATGCGTPGAGRAGTASDKTAVGNTLYSARQTASGKGEAQVSLLARAFLPPQSETHPGFAYYAYLVFADSTPNSAPARRAASAFYLDMLTHVRVSGDKTGIKRGQMAVLYVPLTDRAAAASLVGAHDPQALLAAYDYVRIRGLTRLLKAKGKAIPDVAIIGSTRPLSPGRALDATTIDVVDLADPGTVTERMERFRSAFEAGERQVSEGGQPIVLKRLRDYFAWAEASDRDGPRTLTF